MGIRNGVELAYTGMVTKAHGATGSSDTYYPSTDARGSRGGQFNATVYGTFVGTMVVEKTYDDGTTWLQAYDKFGNAVTCTAPTSFSMTEHEHGVGYRTRCSAYTSGTANARLSQ